MIDLQAVGAPDWIKGGARLDWWHEYRAWRDSGHAVWFAREKATQRIERNS